MRFLLSASLFLSLSPNYALAAGCSLDVSQNPAVGGLKDAQLEYEPTPDRKNQVCTKGKKHVCLYTNGKTPCKEETDSDGKVQPPVCGAELMKEINDDPDHVGKASRSRDPNEQYDPDQQNTFAYNFVPDQNGNMIIMIHPVKDGKVDKSGSLKIEPSAMGEQAVRINTYSGGTPRSQFAVMVSSAQKGSSANGSCPGNISLVGRGSGARDPNGNWYHVANGKQSDGLDGNAANDNIQHNSTYTAGTAY